MHNPLPRRERFVAWIALIATALAAVMTGFGLSLAVIWKVGRFSEWQPERQRG